MNKKLLLTAYIAASALTCLSAGSVCAQSLTPAPQDGSVNAVIASNSGRERRLNGQNGYIGRAGLRPRQPVRVTLQFPIGLAGGSTIVFSPDGGAISPPLDTLKITPAATASFVFQPEAHHGLYRVFVEIMGQRHLLEFYVMDTDNPRNNPPRVKIVD